MSYPPPYNVTAPPPPNPDQRTLPEGWIEQYDFNYQAWFYVNTAETPAKSSWVHPLGPPLPPRPPKGYIPPPGPPPQNNGGWGAPDPYSQSGYGYGGSQQWQGTAGTGYYPQAPPQAPPRVVYADDQKKNTNRSGGMGMGSMLAVGGAGLLGGMLLEDIFN